MKEKNKQINLKWGMRKLSVGLCSVVIGASTVSYTHLDVYKRQQHGYISGQV